MEKKLLPLIVLILLAGAVVYSTLPEPAPEVVAADTYIVWTVTERAVVAEQHCTTTVYRYAVQAKQRLMLDKWKGACEESQRFGLDTTEGYVYYGEQFAFDLNGRDITEQTELNVKRGVEGYVNSTSGVGVYGEYMYQEGKTYVSFYGSNAPDSFVIDNAKEIAVPLYLSPISMSDDGTQVYLGTFTEASYRLPTGIPLFVYDVATKKISQVSYGKDLVIGDFVIDTAGKRLLVVSGTRHDPVEGPSWEVIGPSQLHLVDLVTGKGMELGLATTEEELLTNPQFSPTSASTMSAESNGGTHVITVNPDGTVLDGNDISGNLVEWTDQILVTSFPPRYIILDPTSKQELGSVTWTPKEFEDGELSIQYLGSVTIQNP